jgi:hypothetical protein
VPDPWSHSDSQVGIASVEIVEGATSERADADGLIDKHDDANTFPSWFDPFTEREVEYTQTWPEDWPSEAVLPLFAPNAAINPFDFDAVLPSKEDFACRKARWLVDLLETAGQSERGSLIYTFGEIFTAYPHQSTFKTLAGLALEGFSADELCVAYELKEI